MSSVLGKPTTEVWLVAAMTALGAFVRLWGLDRMGLSHFDEGVYASAGLWIYRIGGRSWFDTTAAIYSPPGVPVLVGVSYALLGVSDVPALLVSIVTGTLTIPAIAWVGRRTFGPGGGVAASAFAALSGAHVAFSRMVLTDGSMLLAWVLAIGLGQRFLERPRLGRALAFGVAVGVAQLFKYNGWMAGAAVAVTALLGVFHRHAETRRASWLALGLGLVAMGAAALVYAPWFRFIESHIGYARLTEIQQSYLGGPRAWPSFWSTQLSQMVALSGQLWGPFSWGAIAWPLAWIGASTLGLGTIGRGRAGGGLSGLLAGGLVLGLLPQLSWWLGLVLLPWLARDPRAGVRVLATWWVLLSVLAPLYHPYARLWLPMHAVGWLILAGVVVQGVGFLSTSTPKTETRRQAIALALGVFLSGIFQLSSGPRPLPGLLAPSDGLRLTAGRISERLERDDGSTPVLDVYVRPPLVFYLNLLGTVQTRPHTDLDSLLSALRPGRIALVDEAQIGGALDPSLEERFDVEVFALDPLSIPTLLDTDPGASWGRPRFATDPASDSPLPVARLWLIRP